MLYQACNKKFKEKNPWYKNCTVNTRWHNFQNFCDDIKTLPGYEMWKSTKSRYVHLDKDIRGNGRKHYSKETCMFVTQKENTLHSVLKGLNYFGYNNYTGELKEFRNQDEFSRDNKLRQSHVNSCINGDMHRHKCWEFFIRSHEHIEKVEENNKLKDQIESLQSELTKVKKERDSLKDVAENNKKMVQGFADLYHGLGDTGALFVVNQIANNWESNK